MKINLVLSNAENLFIDLAKSDYNDQTVWDETSWQQANSSLTSNKPLKKCEKLAQSFLDFDASIIMMTEVGGRGSAELFSKVFLKNQYIVLHTPSNSDRGIDLCYFIKKSLKLNYKLSSFVDFPLGDQRKFSRDALTLKIIKDNKIAFIFILVHLKSKLDKDGTDFEGRTQRLAEAQGLIKIYDYLSKEHKCPILVAGDMNGVIDAQYTENELQVFSENGLIDILTHQKKSREQKISYLYFNKGKPPIKEQLDYLLVKEEFASFFDSDLTFFQTFTADGSLPETYEDKIKLPSDHFPLMTRLTLPD